MPALGSPWMALWTSRLLVFAVGIAAAVLGTDAGAAPRAELTEPFGDVGDALVAPAARFDSVWYVSIADDGYSEPGIRAFFPLYPLLMNVVSLVAGSYLVAGILVSLVAFGIALELLRRLTSLELDDRVAGQAVALMAFAPLAVFYSAVYTEALFLALTIGAFYAARTGHWAWAGALGGLASATRSAGVLLLIPLVILYVWGPRADRPRAGSGRHPLRPDVLWLALVPAGLVAFAAYLGIAEGDLLGMFEGQRLAERELMFPLVGLADGIWTGLEDSVDAVRVSGVGFSHSADQLPWLAFAAIATVGVFRRLPAAYGAWALVSVALPLSVPLAGSPLTSFGRFMLVVFPFWIWLAAWSVEHGRARERVVLGLSALGLAYYTWRFTDWSFVG